MALVAPQTVHSRLEVGKGQSMIAQWIWQPAGLLTASHIHHRKSCNYVVSIEK